MDEKIAAVNCSICLRVPPDLFLKIFRTGKTPNLEICFWDTLKIEKTQNLGLVKQEDAILF